MKEARMGLDYDQLFPGRFLKAGEFQGKDVTLTINEIRLEELPQDRGGNRIRGIIGFKETKKELVLNRTNGECLKGMWGRDTANWLGKRVTLYPAPYDGDVAIRVKGSPDLAEPLQIEVKLPKKRPMPMTMQVTGKRQNGAPKPAPVTDFPPADDEQPPAEHWAKVDGGLP
jgi:hypothetical protein